MTDQLFNRLKAAQQHYALEGLLHPNQRDSFEYGYRAGVVAGYEASMNILLQLLKEEKDNDPDL